MRMRMVMIQSKRFTMGSRGAAIALMLLLFQAFVQGQTNQPAVPNAVDVLVLPPTGDPLTTPPLKVVTTAISATSSNCNKASVPALASATNPFLGQVDDPFHAGRSCDVAIPTGLPDGSGYRVVAIAVATTCNPTGTAVVSPCPGSRSAVGVPPFSILSTVSPPAVLTGVHLTQ